MAKHKFNLGDKVKDLVSGFEGICTGRIEYLNGCIQYLVKPTINPEDGKMLDGYYIDDHQLELVKRKVVPAFVPPKAVKTTPTRTGGPSMRVSERTG